MSERSGLKNILNCFAFGLLKTAFLLLFTGNKVHLRFEYYYLEMHSELYTEYL